MNILISQNLGAHSEKVRHILLLMIANHLVRTLRLTLVGFQRSCRAAHAHGQCTWQHTCIYISYGRVFLRRCFRLQTVVTYRLLLMLSIMRPCVNVCSTRSGWKAGSCTGWGRLCRIVASTLLSAAKGQTLSSATRAFLGARFWAHYFSRCMSPRWVTSLQRTASAFTSMLTTSGRTYRCTLRTRTTSLSWQISLPMSPAGSSRAVCSWIRLRPRRWCLEQQPGWRASNLRAALWRLEPECSLWRR